MFYTRFHTITDSLEADIKPSTLAALLALLVACGTDTTRDHPDNDSSDAQQETDSNAQQEADVGLDPDLATAPDDAGHTADMRTRPPLDLGPEYEPLPEGSGPSLWVDNSCPVNGDGSTEDCANEGTGPFNDLHLALAAVVPGNTVMIKDGTGEYVTNNLGDYRPHVDGGFHVVAPNGSTDPITIRSAPGHFPLFANCAADDFENYCPHATFTASGGRIVFSELNIQGGVGIRGDVAVVRSRLSKGYEPEGDGNIGAIKVVMPGGWETANVGPFRNNYFHDLHGLETNAFTAAWIYIFHSRDVVIEYNTFEGFEYRGGHGALVDKHSHSQNLTFRHNLIIDGKGGPFGSQTHMRSFGNVIHCGGDRGGTGFEVAKADQFHNTVVDCDVALYVAPEDPRYPERAGRDGQLYNNIFAQIHDANLRRREVPGEEPDHWLTGLETIDFNAYTPDRWFWWLHNNYGQTWEEWQTGIAADYGFDQNSAELECAFRDPAGHDYRLVPDSECTTFGRTSADPAGDPVELGAFALTDCVGHLCGPDSTYIPYNPEWRTGDHLARLP